MKCINCSQPIERVEKTSCHKSYYIHTRKTPEAFVFCVNESNDFIMSLKNIKYETKTDYFTAKPSNSPIKKDKYGDYTISPFKKIIIIGGLKYAWFSYLNRGLWNRINRSYRLFPKLQDDFYTITEFEVINKTLKQII